MRYYDLKLTPPSGTKAKARHWTSYPKGLSGPFDPGALNIDFDILVYAEHAPAENSSITIEGVALQDLLQANQFGSQKGPFWTIEFSGGMGPGLPLNNPKQAGLILTGNIFQSFGNWQGTEMTLDLVFNPGDPHSIKNPGNVVLNWKKGTQLSQALANTFSTAYPGIKQQIDINSNLTLNHDEVGYYYDLTGLAKHIMGMTHSWGGNTSYPGVSIAMQKGAIQANDGSKTPATVQLSFLDFVGQPTWIKPNQILVKLVMRADLQLGSVIKFPAGMQNMPGFVQTTQASMPSSIKYKSAFQGQFNVIEIRHVGNFRTTDAAQWVTMAICVPEAAKSS
jgi:hypothetical protein